VPQITDKMPLDEFAAAVGSALIAGLTRTEAAHPGWSARLAPVTLRVMICPAKGADGFRLFADVDEPAEKFTEITLTLRREEG